MKYPDSKTRKLYGQVGKRIAYRIKKLMEKADDKQRTSNDAKP